jgi:hypothetical protein
MIGHVDSHEAPRCAQSCASVTKASEGHWLALDRISVRAQQFSYNRRKGAEQIKLNPRYLYRAKICQGFAPWPASRPVHYSSRLHSGVAYRLHRKVINPLIVK